MTEERLIEIKDSIDLQAELAKNTSAEEMIKEEQELYDELINLKKENNELRLIYKKTADRLHETGNTDLALYFDAQINNNATFSVETIDYYKEYRIAKEILHPLGFENVMQLSLKYVSLHEEIKQLKGGNEEFYKLMEMQNKREYRSKFLKDFQKEHGKNVFPDYDEIYKRYDDYKSRVEEAIKIVESYNLGKYDYSIPSSGIIDLLEALEGKRCD